MREDNIETRGYTAVWGGEKIKTSFLSSSIHIIILVITTIYYCIIFYLFCTYIIIP